MVTGYGYIFLEVYTLDYGSDFIKICLKYKSNHVILLCRFTIIVTMTSIYGWRNF